MYYMGIDVGGTTVKGALTTEAGEILREAARDTESVLGPDHIGQVISDLILELAAGYTPEELGGIGVGCPGTVDNAAGQVLYANNLGLAHYDLRAYVEAHTGFRIHLVNDANAAAVGEVAAGCGRGMQDLVVVTLGTGVGGGVVVNGMLLTGYTGAASEVGHIVIEDGGARCTCGRKGCFESYASATGLIRMAAEAMEAHPESLLHELMAKAGKLSGKVVFSAADAGDAAAEAVVHRYIHYLAVGLANLTNLFFPEAIALSGGIANRGEKLLEPLRKEMADMVYGASYALRHVKLINCTLGYRAGMIGAAMYAKQCISRDNAAE